MKQLKNKIFIIALLAICTFSKAQEVIIDRVIAVVAASPILQSEVEAQYHQLLTEEDGANVNENTRCKILEEILYQKLLLAQAIKDSVEVSNDQVEQELERRLRYYITQFGSEENFEAFYGKKIDDWKAELKDNVRDILLAQEMQRKVVGTISVTPNEVKKYFESIHPDSIPFINAEVEIAHIVKQPKISDAAKKEARTKLEGIREKIVKGEKSFAVMAGLYSDDPGSASRGGLYEKVPRGQMVPEWEGWAYKLKPNEISEVFETVYGYFIVQLIERRGDEVDVRSLLIAPKMETGDLLKSKNNIDSIYIMLQTDTIKFSDVAAKHSDDADSKNMGGIIVNPYTGSTRFEMDMIGQYDQNIAFAIEKLKPGEYTKPMAFVTKDGKQAYRIVQLKNRTEPHKANLKDDYQQIQEAAMMNKQKNIISEWIKKKAAITHIRIDDDYKNCNFSNRWIN